MAKRQSKPKEPAQPVIERSSAAVDDNLREYAILPFYMSAPSSIQKAFQTLDVEYLKANYSDMLRFLAYGEYDDMEQAIPEVKTALDIYADVACMGTKGDEKAFKINSKNAKVKTILDDLYARLDMNTILWSLAREVRKYGDDFEELVFDKSGKNIMALKNLSIYTMVRNEDKDGNLKNFTQRDFQGKDIATLSPDQVIHLRFDQHRNLTPVDDKKHMYGTSILAPLRRIFPLLIAMEEGMVVGRLYRSQMRYKIIIDVTGKTDKEASDLIKQYKKNLKRKNIINNLSGRLDLAALSKNILDPTDDFYIGARKDGVVPDVTAIEGQGNLGAIEDVKHFQGKLFAVLKLPKSFMAYETDVNAKATLMVQDVEFGRTVRRVQAFLSAFVKQVGDIQLGLLGLDPADEKNAYEIIFANVSVEDEANQATVLNTKATACQVLIGAGVIDAEYAATKILEIPLEEFKKIKPPQPNAGYPFGLPANQLQAAVEAIVKKVIQEQMAKEK